MDSDLQCQSCGAKVVDAANFCPICGARIAPPSADSRRQVTILFCDLVGSTAIGTSVDSEVMRGLMARFFDGAKVACERHGGTVEKYIGDAVMAVFGLPEVHEDDALRAVRAAIDVRASVKSLSDSVEAQFGRSLQVRTGVNTGDVVAADDPSGQRLVTGDAVNLAARLQQAAEPGDLLLGPLTYRLTRQFVAAEPLAPMLVKGFGEAIEAHRVFELVTESDARTAPSGFVGRTEELDLLRHRFAACLRGPSCELVTVIGAPGIGKSRLVHEFLDEVRDQATILRGRCLPYGEGITYWPVALIVKAAAGIEDADDVHRARGRLDAIAATMPDGPSIAGALAAAIGLESATSASREQIGWAFRHFLEGISSDRPLIVVVDDIQWGDPTLLDLLESTAALSANAPILILCLARPEIADQRSGWGTGLPGALTIALEPLSNEASDSLMEILADHLPLPLQSIQRLRDAAEGNPLFLEELLAMFLEEGLLRQVDGRWEAVGDLRQTRIPPTVEAVLAARLDRLPLGDRTVAQRAAVIGRIFERGAIIELSPEADRPEVERNLVSLVRKEVIRSDARGIGGDDTFRFRHLLVRDAAYERLSKQERAELHHRFADWLERTVGERLVEFEEILGYHLEQAYQYRRELGLADEATSLLERRVAEHLGRAAGRAWDRSDLPAAASLLARAMAAAGTGDLRWPEWAADRVEALTDLGDEAAARETMAVLDQTAAASSPDLAPVAWATVARVLFSIRFGGFEPARATAQLQEAIERFQITGDNRGLSRALVRSAWVSWAYGQAGHTAEKLLSALNHAQLAGSRGDELRTLAFLARSLLWGPTPVADALTTCEKILDQAGDDRFVQGYVARTRAVLFAMEGRFEAALAEQASCLQIFRDLGLPIEVEEAAQSGSQILDWAGDGIAAVELLASSIANLESLKERSFQPTHRGMLARLLVEVGNLEQAEAEALASRDTAERDDLMTESLWRGPLAMILARRGDVDDADRLSLEAVTMVADADFWLVAPAYAARADVLATLGRQDEADAALARAIDIFERKGATAVVQQLKAGTSRAVATGDAL